MHKTIEKSGDLLHLLEEMRNRKDYLIGHSTMIAYISGSIVSELDWHTETSYMKLGFAAMLHDVTLTSEELAKVVKITPDVERKFSRQMISKIKRHPIAVTEMIREIPGIHPDIDNIVLCHHERPDGSGFPRGLNRDKIPLLAAIFIISEEFVNRIFGQKITTTLLEKTINDFSTIFQEGNFKNPYKAFLQVIIKSGKIKIED